MREGDSCPVSGRQADLRAARTNGMLVAAVLAVALAWPEARFLVPLLAADFAVKVLMGADKAPLFRFSALLDRRLGWLPRMGDAAPKRFAASLGLAFNLAATVSLVLGWLPGFYAFAGICLVCAAMEGLLDFCMGCWFHGLLHRRPPEG